LERISAAVITPVVTAIVFGVFAFLFSAFWARMSIWWLAFNMSARYPSLDYDLVYRHVKQRALNRRWLGFNLIGSALVSAGVLFYQLSPRPDDFVMDERFTIATLVAGIGVVILLTFDIVQSKMLFYLSVKELGIGWPPPRTNQSPQG
jgi:hypothetical protein